MVHASAQVNKNSSGRSCRRERGAGSAQISPESLSTAQQQCRFDHELSDFKKADDDVRGVYKEPTQKLEHIYNDVYYGQLVIHHRDGTSPGEVEWSEFVKEARQTGPEFKSGKEKFRQAVELLARFTKRAPQRLEQVVELWRKGDVNEALHFLGLVLTMANSTSHELEQASDIFSNVQT